MVAILCNSSDLLKKTFLLESMAVRFFLLLRESPFSNGLARLVFIFLLNYSIYSFITICSIFLDANWHNFTDNSTRDFESDQYLFSIDLTSPFPF